MVPFESEEIVLTELLNHAPSRLLLAVHGVGRRQRPWRRIHRPQQRFEVGNLVSLLLNRHLLGRHSQVVRHSGEELQRLAIAPPAAAQRLAVYGPSGDGRRLLRQHLLGDARH